jgi:hypothetical protein
MGEMLLEATGGESAKEGTGGFVFIASDPRIALMKMTASGTITKSGTLCDSLPCPCGMAARTACR